MADATFEDGAERPLRLIARDADDLQVISTLVQDAVLTGADLRYTQSRRRFTILLNRFRWEDREQAQAARRRVERVRSILDFSDVTAVSHQGLERDADTILSLLSVDFTPEAEVEAGDPAGPGRVTLTCTTFTADPALVAGLNTATVGMAGGGSVETS